MKDDSSWWVAERQRESFKLLCEYEAVSLVISAM